MAGRTHCLWRPTARDGPAPYDLQMTTRSHPQAQHRRELAEELDVARAEGDYRRLRAAYMDLGRGDANEVALAMVGADMERAQVSLQRLSGARQHSMEIAKGNVIKRDTRRLAQAAA